MNKNFLSTRSKVSAGFTLIELLVVIAIVSMVTSVVLVSSVNGRTKKELETNAREFAAVVREAQNYALTGKQMSSDKIPCYSQVFWVSGESRYIMTFTDRNPTDSSCTAPSPFPITYSLKNGVTIVESGSFTFALPWAKITNNITSMPLDSGSITVNFTKGSDFYTVCIYADGRVLEVPNTSAAYVCV